MMTLKTKEKLIESTALGLAILCDLYCWGSIIFLILRGRTDLAMFLLVFIIFLKLERWSK